MSFTIDGKTYNKSDLSVLKKCNTNMLKTRPFPHLYINECLDPVIYNYLESHYPSNSTIAGEMPLENCRYQLNNNNALKNKDVDPIWKMFVEYHTSKEFHKEVESIFGKERLKNFRNLKGKNYNKLGIGRRKHPVKLNKGGNKIVLDCQIGINSPTTMKNSVIGPHRDNGHEIYAGLLYLKHPEDVGAGGDLNLLKIKKKYKTLEQFENIVGKKRSRIFNAIDDDLAVFSTIKYEKNTFVLFLNDLNALHEVTPREINPISRRLVNIIGEYY